MTKRTNNDTNSFSFSLDCEKGTKNIILILKEYEIAKHAKIYKIKNYTLSILKMIHVLNEVLT